MTDSSALISLEPYPDYKDVAVNWLKKVPSSWRTARLKWLAEINPSRMQLQSVPDDTEVSFYPMEEVGYGSLMEDNVRPIADLKTGYSYFEEGDVLVAKITPSFENGKGALASNLRNGIGFGTTELHVIRPTGKLLPRFLYYLTYSTPFRRIGAGMMQGTAGQKRVPDDFIEQFEAPLPSIHEQRAIAAFLDRETAKIDALVEKKQRLIELLEEKRTALISHAVTKGLDPDAPMKDSGVEWLGEVPEHWDVTRLKSVARMNKATLSEETDPELEFDYIEVGSVNDRGEVEETERYIFEKAPSRARRLVSCGDTIISTVRTYLKAIAFIDEQQVDAIVSTGFAVLHPSSRVQPRYLWRIVQSETFISHVVANSVGVSYPAINPSRLAEQPVWLPPADEQEEIVAYLDAETLKIDRLVDKVGEAIDKLSEYRTSLIAAAVTGKIDVRDEVEVPA